MGIFQTMSLELPTGTVFDDRYEIIELVGEGGMGQVYKARELELNRLIALKLLHPSLIQDMENYNRFKQEGKVLSRLHHPGIISLYRYGVYQKSVAYIAMEFLSGETLRSFLNKQGVLSSTFCINLGKQICSALAHAHANGVIHRDLTPGNIILTDENQPGGVKIIDFGLAHLAADSGMSSEQNLTQTGLLIGSIHYMSPEQCLGKRADERSDIYALGCVLFQALTGEPPFSADNPIGLMNLHVTSKVPSVQDVNSAEAVDAAWDSILSRAMAKKADERYQSMSEFASDLELLQEGRLSKQRSTVKRPASHIVVVGVLALLGTIAVSLITMRSASLPRSNQTTPGATPTRAKVLHNRVFGDFINVFGVRKEAIESSERIPLLQTWIQRYGSQDARQTALAHAYLCLELAQCSSDVRYSYSAKCPLFDLPTRYCGCNSDAQNERKRALGWLDKALNSKALDELEHSELHYLKVVLRQLGTTNNERLALYQEALKDRNISDGYVRGLRRGVAEMYRNSGFYVEEEKVLREILESEKNGAREYFQLAECLLLQGKKKEARVILTEQLELLSQNHWTQYAKRYIHFLAQALIEADMPEEALAACTSCESNSENPLTVDGRINGRPCLNSSDHNLLKTIALTKLRRLEAARELVPQIDLRSAEDRSHVMYPLTAICQEVGIPASKVVLPHLTVSYPDFNWQIEVCRLVQKHDPGLTAKLYEATSEYLRTQNLAWLRAYNIRVISDEVALMYCLGKPHHAAELVTSALKSTNEAQLSYAVMDLRVLLAMAKVGSSDFAEAQSILNSLLNDFKVVRPPDNLLVTTQVLQSKLYRRAGENEKADEIARAALTVALRSYEMKVDEKALVLETYSDYCERAGRTEEARQMIQKSHQVFPRMLREGLRIQLTM